MSWPSEEFTQIIQTSPVTDTSQKKKVSAYRESRSRSRSNSFDRFKKSRLPTTRSGKIHIVRPNLAGGMLSFKQFMEMQHDPIPPFEAQQCYDDYKSNYERKHLEIFFSEHKSEPWFIEKYDPIVSQK